MTIRAVADTHAILWYLYNDSRLSITAGSFIDAAVSGGDQIAISSITLAEMVYLTERNRIDPAAVARVLEVLDRSSSTLVEIPLDRGIVRSMRQIDRASIPELPDRIVAATALHLGVPIISRDREIRASRVPSIW
jgi:PIN domain nuclease of toxin-antitoxin system